MHGFIASIFAHVVRYRTSYKLINTICMYACYKCVVLAYQNSHEVERLRNRKLTSLAVTGN